MRLQKSRLITLGFIVSYPVGFCVITISEGFASEFARDPSFFPLTFFLIFSGFC